MTRDQEIMLLVMAANGGTMEREDLCRECERVRQLSAAAYRQWQDHIRPLVQQNAQKVRRGEL